MADEQVVNGVETVEAERGDAGGEVVQKKRKRRTRKRNPTKIPNLDSNSGQHRFVTVDSLTVLITEYREKQDESEESDS